MGPQEWERWRRVPCAKISKPAACARRSRAPRVSVPPAGTDATLSHRKLFTQCPAARAWVKGPRGCFSLLSTHCEEPLGLSLQPSQPPRIFPELEQALAFPSSPTLYTVLFYYFFSSLIPTELRFVTKVWIRNQRLLTPHRTCHFPRRPTDLRHFRGD